MQVNVKTWFQNAAKREGCVIRSVFKTYSERNSRTWPTRTISNCTGGVDVWSTKVVIRLRGVTIHSPWNWIWGSEAPRTQNQNAANVRCMLLKTHLDAPKKQQQNVTQNVNAWIPFWNAERQNGNAKRQNVALSKLRAPVVSLLASTPTPYVPPVKWTQTLQTFAEARMLGNMCLADFLENLYFIP